MEKIVVASVQFNHHAGDKEYNLAVIEHFVKEAHAKEVQLIAFPEMCITGYWHVRSLSREEVLALAEPIPAGPSTQRLLALAERHRMAIGAGLIEESEDGVLYNSYVVALPDGRHYVHRKLHTFISAHMASGSSYTVFDVQEGVRVGVLTCYDNNIIENVRLTALMGADILLAPHQTGGCNSASPGGMKPIDVELWEQRSSRESELRAEFAGAKGRAWLMRWLPSRAHDNGLFILFANGVGRDDDEVRTGSSMIIDPYGTILSESTAIGDDMVVCRLDLTTIAASNGRRWMKARRPELYGPLSIPTGLEEETRTVRFTYEAGPHSGLL